MYSDLSVIRKCSCLREGCCKEYFCNDCLSDNYRYGIDKASSEEITLCKDCSTHCEYCEYSSLTEGLKKYKTSTCENLLCPFGEEEDDDIYNPKEDAICIRYANSDNPPPLISAAMTSTSTLPDHSSPILQAVLMKTPCLSELTAHHYTLNSTVL